MGECPYCGEAHNVGFVATRLAGTDGVSLEAEKWAEERETEALAHGTGRTISEAERSAVIDTRGALEAAGLSLHLRR